MILANCALSAYETLEETKTGNYSALFWYEFCPATMNIISPQSEPLSSEWGNSYLNEYWKRDSALHSVRFSIPTVLAEAGFEGLNPDNNGAIAYFHCEAKICPKDEESTCSTERISDGQEHGSESIFFDENCYLSLQNENFSDQKLHFPIFLILDIRK